MCILWLTTANLCLLISENISVISLHKINIFVTLHVKNLIPFYERCSIQIRSFSQCVYDCLYRNSVVSEVNQINCAWAGSGIQLLMKVCRVLITSKTCSCCLPLSEEVVLNCRIKPVLRAKWSCQCDLLKKV